MARNVVVFPKAERVFAKLLEVDHVEVKPMPPPAGFSMFADLTAKKTYFFNDQCEPLPFEIKALTDELVQLAEIGLLKYPVKYKDSDVACVIFENGQWILWKLKSVMVPVPGPYNRRTVVPISTLMCDGYYEEYDAPTVDNPSTMNLKVKCAKLDGIATIVRMSVKDYFGDFF